MRQLASYATREISLVPDPDRQRPSDVMRCVGVPNPLLRAAGWRPTISLAQSLHDTLAWWRLAAREGPGAPIHFGVDLPASGVVYGSQSSARVVT